MHPSHLQKPPYNKPPPPCSAALSGGGEGGYVLEKEGGEKMVKEAEPAARAAEDLYYILCPIRLDAHAARAAAYRLPES